MNNNTEFDGNTTMNTTNASSMNKSKSSSKMHANNANNNVNSLFNDSHKDEDQTFRSIDRTTRDKMLDTKVDFKKLRPQFYNTN